MQFESQRVAEIGKRTFNCIDEPAEGYGDVRSYRRDVDHPHMSLPKGLK